MTRTLDLLKKQMPRTGKLRVLLKLVPPLGSFALYLIKILRTGV